MLKLIILSIILLLKPTYQDIYLHNPRGSNNRLNENTVQRTNNNRVFDSQNNNRGGYNTGDVTADAAQTETQQYAMRYFQSGSNGSSYLNVEWTAQHGCGAVAGQINKNCLVVLQYMCQPANDFSATNTDRLRDGTSTDSQNHNRIGNNEELTQAAFLERKRKSINMNRALHESFEHYDNCYYRQRNSGLFVADQNLKNNEKGYSSAIFTRQNANGGRSGYECPEERDYYPYWHPNGGWKDIALLTSNTAQCNYLKSESFNVKPKHYCIEFYANKVQKPWSRWNTKADCDKNGGMWTAMYNYLEKATQYTDQNSCEANPNHKWDIPFDSTNINQPECLVLLEAPVCGPASWSRQNHLGNTRDGKPTTYQWRFPNFPSKRVQRCTFRIRYNISTSDFDEKIDAKSNGANSPIRNNPNINLSGLTLRMAINTAQTGRVFEDRSHIFYLLPRPSTYVPESANVYNLNVRGKRGNIVQTFPAVEYDFVPNELRVGTSNDLVHLQWTGSNTHNNNGAGDAGQGKGGSDRSNFVLLDEINENYPLDYDETYFWSDIDLVGYVTGDHVPSDQSSSYITRYTKSNDVKKDLALYLASSGYYQCYTNVTCAGRSMEALPKVNTDLNTAPASVPGAIIKFKVPGASYNFMASRNNAFSNRNQNGIIRVV